LVYVDNFDAEAKPHEVFMNATSVDKILAKIQQMALSIGRQHNNRIAFIHSFADPGAWAR
jgi:hypothetical protein